MFCLLSAERYEPPPRLGHATASVGHKVYLWGGWQKGLPSEHTSPEKTRMTSVVNVFDLQTGEWDELPTSGTPPLGELSFRSFIYMLVVCAT